MDRAGKPFLLDATAYLGSAADALFRRPILLPVILLLLTLLACNAVALLAPSVLLYGLNLVFWGLIAQLFAIGILRLASQSSRRTWTPDGGYWLYLLVATLIGVLPALVASELAFRFEDISPARAVFLGNSARAVLEVFFAPWLVAIAVERPLAWRPANWLRRFARWFPYLLFYVVLLTVPFMALEQLLLPSQYMGTAWFWIVLLGYSLLGFLILMIRLGLDVAAYRRVAQG